MRELYLVSPPCLYTRLPRAFEICKRFYMLILHLVLIVSFGSTDWGEVCLIRIMELSTVWEQQRIFMYGIAGHIRQQVSQL